MSNPYVEAIYEATMAAGTLAGKVSGAEGCFMMTIIVPQEPDMDVTRVLLGFEGQISNCHFTDFANRAWRV